MIGAVMYCDFSHGMCVCVCTSVCVFPRKRKRFPQCFLEFERKVYRDARARSSRDCKHDDLFELRRARQTAVCDRPRNYTVSSNLSLSRRIHIIPIT